ncbi:Tumor necrosis factor receptor super member 10A [Branchiostoma belcheri]|nr:Tumor necrosis factor receptor super member 10A [Branchiostoma belcheri]
MEDESDFLDALYTDVAHSLEWKETKALKKRVSSLELQDPVSDEDLAQDIFKKLEKEGHFGRGNLQYLTDLLTDLGRADLGEKVQTAAAVCGLKVSPSWRLEEMMRIWREIVRDGKLEPEPENKSISDQKEEATVLRKHFRAVAQEVSPLDWRRFARHLGLSEGQIQHIGMRQKNNSYEGVIESLYVWENQLGSSATYRKLREALNRAGMENVADSIWA